MATILWRVISKRYQNDAMSGAGAKKFGGRFHPPGTSVVYAATSKSQAMLEVFTTPPKLTWKHNFVVIPIVVPGSVACKQIELSALPYNWRVNPISKEIQNFGKELMSKNEFAVFFVPSDVVYGEYIALINPFHEDFTRIIPAPAESIFWEDQPFLESQIMKIDSYKDVFLCHASEDKASIVMPLYRELFQTRVSCWYDDAEIKWGDSITEKVNDGLSKSEYVIVILTENFLKKNWPKRELMAALNKESSTGRIVVLPLIAGTNAFKNQVQQELFLESDKRFAEWKNNPTEIASLMRDRLSNNY